MIRCRCLMMSKFQLYSDIHTEFLDKTQMSEFMQRLDKSRCANTIILAGDIGHCGCRNLTQLLEYCNSNYVNVLYVLGNHEYYSSKKTFHKLNAQYHSLADTFNNVTILDNCSKQIDDAVFIGSTLWSQTTDTENLMDYVKILDYSVTRNRKIPVTSEFTNILHEKAKKYLIDAINESEKCIVVTHFPPLQANTSDPIYNDQPQYLRDYFASNILLDPAINRQHIVCWCYGHTHYSNDFVYNGVRLFSNQIGYTEEKLMWDSGTQSIFQ